MTDAAPLPIDDALPALRSALAAHQAPCSSRRPAPARRRASPLALLDEPWAERQAPHPARAAPARRPRCRGAHGRDARREGWRDDRLARAAAEPRLEAHADRGRHRGRVHPHDPRRSRARGRGGCSVRRVPRALARRRSRPRASRSTRSRALREDLRLLVMSATLDGARVRALLGDAPLIESQGRAFPVATRYVGRNPTRAHRGRGRARDARRARKRSRLDPRLPAGAGRNPPRRGDPRGPSPVARTSTLRRSMARWTAARRISPSRPPPRGGARSCSPPRSPRRRSRSRRARRRRQRAHARPGL